MEKVTITVKDGEVTVPVIGKVIKDKQITLLYRINDGCRIEYLYPRTFGEGECSTKGWRVHELENAKPCSVETWNLVIQGACLARINQITDWAAKHSL